MSALAGNDQHVWSCVSFTSNRAYYFVTYTAYWPEGALGKNILLSSISQVIEFMKENGKQYFINQLILVSPQHINKSPYWRMDPLLEIWSDVHRDGQLLIYRLADGRQYVDELAIFEPTQTDRMKCLLRFPQPVDSAQAELSNSIESGAS